MPLPSMYRGAAGLILLAGCVTATAGPSAVSPAHDVGRLDVTTRDPAARREQTADQQVHHVLGRLGFGPRPGDVARVRAVGVDRWIATQLQPADIPDPAADRLLSSYEMLSRPTSEVMSLYQEGRIAMRQLQRQAARSGDSSSRHALRAAALRSDPELRARLRRTQRVLGDVQSARVARAVVSERQLQEVMTDFWENHFSVYAGKGITRLLVPAYDRDVIRPHAMGDFRTLLGAVAKSPAMLFYLDQWQSAADSAHQTLGARRRSGVGARHRAPVLARRPRGLNENYARELMELHTLGVDAGYSQQDVSEVARALTGWTMVSRQRPEFVFRPQLHDAGEKVVLGHRMPAGRGIEDGEEVLDLLARDPRTARFIAHKLSVRFVSDAPPAALVGRAAATFLLTKGDIREVVRTIVTSPEFFSAAAYRSKVKSPFELVSSALRAVGADGDSTMRSAQMVAFLGQPIFGRQAPDGWPETGDAWMNAGAILNRINFGLALAAGRIPGAGLAHWPDAARLRSAGREAQVDAVVIAFLGGQVSRDTRDILMKGENPLAGPPQQLAGLAQVVGLAIGAPEFQRR